MTPQAARIDAHPLQRDAPTRLCYMGTVLHTRTDGFGGSRSPLQVGAELFGHAGIESDVEILEPGAGVHWPCWRFRMCISIWVTSGFSVAWPRDAGLSAKAGKRPV